MGSRSGDRSPPAHGQALTDIFNEFGGGVVAKLIENVSEVLEGELVHEQGLGIIARDDGEVSTGPGGCVVDGLIAGEVLGQHGDVVALTTVAAGENECGVETDDAGSGREELAE